MGFGNVRHTPDLITPKLAALHVYQLMVPAPKPPPGSFAPAAAERGRALFNGQAQCATCHVPPLFTEPGWNMHSPAEIGIDNFQSSRSPDQRCRTTPLGGLFTRAKGGFYHDGRFPDLGAVVQHYDAHLNLNLTADEQKDLIEYLKSL
jgi:cytochrome c peroxidase